MRAPRASARSQPLEHEEGGAFAHDEAVALDVERAGGAGRVVVAAGQRPHAGEGGDGDGRDHGLGAAGEDDVGGAVADQPGPLADGVAAGGAGGGDAEVRAGPAELHGHDGRRGVGHHHRHEERPDPQRPPLAGAASPGPPCVPRPPMPVPATTPQRAGSAPGSPASSTASMAAAKPSWASRSTRRTSLGPRYSTASKSFTSQAKRTGRSDGVEAGDVGRHRPARQHRLPERRRGRCRPGSSRPCR